MLALGAQDDWLWQMHADIAVDDSTHELLWRQTLRWLVNDVPDRVELVLTEESGPGDAVSLRAIVRDSAYRRRNGASVTATVAGPNGAMQNVSFDWAVDRDGEYVASFVPAANGVQEVRVRAIVGADTAVSPPSYVRVAEPVNEYFGAERRETLLEELARETGGRSYLPECAGDIPRDLNYSPSGATSVQRLDSWEIVYRANGGEETVVTLSEGNACGRHDPIFARCNSRRCSVVRMRWRSSAPELSRI